MHLISIPGGALICAPNKLFLPPATTLALLVFSMMLCRLPPGNIALYGDRLADVAARATAGAGAADSMEGEAFNVAGGGFTGDSRGVAPGEDPGNALAGAGLALALWLPL